MEITLRQEYVISNFICSDLEYLKLQTDLESGFQSPQDCKPLV